MNEPPSPIAPDVPPRLPHGVRLVHNEAQGGWVLLAPERVFKADAVSAEVLKRCTGEATFEAIIDDLAAAFKAPRERILTDVTAMCRASTSITSLHKKTWMAGQTPAVTLGKNEKRNGGRRRKIAQPARLVGRVDASLPAWLSLLLEPARTGTTRRRARYPNLGARVQGSRRPGRPASSSVGRRARRAARSCRDHGSRARVRPLHQSDHVRGRHYRRDIAQACRHGPRPRADLD